MKSPFGRWMTVGLVVMGHGLPACDDLSPLPYFPPPAPDAALLDGSVDGAAVAACRECIEQGPCASGYAACSGAPKCKIAVDCVTSTDCWRSVDVTNITQLPQCALDCLARAGASSSQDPGITSAVGLFACVSDPARCFDACMKK